ncbi:hypothetical protein D3C84_1226490 [compost metagenome]
MLPRVVLPQSRAWAWYRPRLWPISWATVRRVRLLWIQALDGKAPTWPMPL